MPRDSYTSLACEELYKAMGETRSHENIKINIILTFRHYL